MTKEQWAAIFVLAGLSKNLAYVWWQKFSATPTNNDLEYCDKLKSDYPDKYEFLMENSAEFRAVCCVFSNHSNHTVCAVATV
jgi:hypothetical protein